MYAFTFCIQKFGYSQTLFSNIECIVQICFMLTGPQQAIVNNIRSAKYIHQINNTCRLFPYTMHCLNDLTSVCPTILVKNLETLVCISSSPLLTWVLQSSQCSRIRVAHHWGRRGAYLSKCKKFLKKLIQEKQFLLQRFVMSIVVMSHH